jgi:hypothetical protein
MAYKKEENESENRQKHDNILLLSVAHSHSLRLPQQQRGQRYDVRLIVI